MIKNFKRATMKISGLTEKQYESKFRTFSQRVANFNYAAGTNYSAAEMFYYRYRYADDLSNSLQSILDTPGTRWGKGQHAPTGTTLAKATASAKENLLYRWAGMIKKSREDQLEGFGSGLSWQVAEDLRQGKITPAEANERLKELRKYRDARRKTDPAQGSP